MNNNWLKNDLNSFDESNNKNENENKFVWNTKKINEYFESRKNGIILDYPKPFLKKDINKKSPNLTFAYTKEEIEIFKKCINDVVYFSEEYAYSMTDEGVIKIKLRPYQIDILQTFQNNRDVVFLASRQIGKTVTTAIFIAWYICTNKDKNILIVSKDATSSKEIISKIKAVYDNLPYFIKPGVFTDNVYSIHFDNGCKIMSEATTPNSGRGYTIHLLYADEFAFVSDNISEQFFTSIYPTLSSSKISKFIITSTPNGANKFYEIYMESLAKKNTFKDLRVDWFQVEGRDEEWKQKQISTIGEDAFNQEYELNFFKGTSSLLTEDQKVRLIENSIEYEFKEIDALHDLFLEKNIKYDNLKWHPSITNIDDLKDYFIVITIDPAKGTLNDYTVFNFFKLELSNLKKIQNTKPTSGYYDYFNLNQIGVFRDNTIIIENSAILLGEIIKNLLDPSKVRIVLEVNFMASDFYINQILGYYQDIIDEDMFIKTYHSTSSTAKKLGVLMRKDNKITYCNLLKKMDKERRIYINEKTTCEELLTFSKNSKGTYENQSGNDDLAISCVLTSAYFFDSYNYKNGHKILNRGFEDHVDMYIDTLDKDTLDMVLNNVNKYELSNKPIIDDDLLHKISDILNNDTEYKKYLNSNKKFF